MKYLCLIALLVGASAKANTFSFVQPVDDEVRSALVWKNKTLAATISDYGMYTMVASPFVYAALKKDRWKRLGVVSGVTAGVFGVTFLTKNIFKRPRPGDRKDRKSFFSGHTSSSFVGAGLMCSQANPWTCAGSLAVATGVGYLRIAADKHWFSDVMVGMGVGVSSGLLFPQLFMSF